MLLTSFICFQVTPCPISTPRPTPLSLVATSRPTPGSHPIDARACALKKIRSCASRSTIRSVPASIGLYRDVWIAAIASSRTRLATLMGVMCNTSQCELRSLRVNSGMLNVIRIVTYNTLPPL